MNNVSGSYLPQSNWLYFLISKQFIPNTKAKANLLFALYTALFLCNSITAQVGINTQNPKGMFHIVTNPANTVSHDVLFEDDKNGGISITVGGEITPSASISLNATNKAFIPNIVSLNDARGTGSEIPNPIKKPVNGMVVYNNKIAGIPPNNVVPGLYVFSSSENRWNYITTAESNHQGMITSFFLANNFAIPILNSYNDFLTAGQSMPLKSSSSSEVSNFINISSEAAYAVSLDLFGSIPDIATQTGYTRMVVYAAVILTDENNQKQILDTAEICPPAYNGTNRKVTYPLTLGFNAKPGDKISILVGALNSSPVWTLLPETSVVIWKV